MAVYPTFQELEMAVLISNELLCVEYPLPPDSFQVFDYSRGENEYKTVSVRLCVRVPTDNGEFKDMRLPCRIIYIPDVEHFKKTVKYNFNFRKSKGRETILTIQSHLKHLNYEDISNI